MEKKKEVGRANVYSRCSISGKSCFLYADTNRKLSCTSLHKTDALGLKGGEASHPTKVCRFRLQECQESTFQASLSDT